jgi:hypothetical protein
MHERDVAGAHEGDEPVGVAAHDALVMAPLGSAELASVSG